jgi:hypothetical protein
MYRKTNDGQLDIYDFILPFGGHLKADNRWVKLRQTINWELVEEEYGRNFANKDAGQEAYPADVAFGSLYIQRLLGFTDRELVDQIAENPYMQYFIGYKEYRNERPFDPSLLVAFRKRLPEEAISRLTERMFIRREETCRRRDSDDDDRNSESGGDSDGSSDVSDNGDVSHGSKDGADTTNLAAELPNKGTLIIDATCAPADIAFPTDLELCDKARSWTERILDRLWEQHGAVTGGKRKPRTYREAARRRFLNINKRRRKPTGKIRRELRYQLNCIHRNLCNIDKYLNAYGDDGLRKVEKARLRDIRTFYAQQKEMLDKHTHTVKDRIVSLSQPWVRPIVRGKAKTPTEFGAKISISVVDGYTFIDRISFDAYNEAEGKEFERVVEEYRRRFGCYPQRILADKLYRSRPNRNFCKQHGIRMSGPRLGRPGKKHADDLRQELKEIGERNAVEGKFGNGKRKLNLSLIMAKLKETAGTMIAMDVFILNMERLSRKGALFSCGFFEFVGETLLTGCFAVEWQM